MGEVPGRADDSPDHESDDEAVYRTEKAAPPAHPVAWQEVLEQPQVPAHVHTGRCAFDKQCGCHEPQRQSAEGTERHRDGEDIEPCESCPYDLFAAIWSLESSLHHHPQLEKYRNVGLAGCRAAHTATASRAWRVFPSR